MQPISSPLILTLDIGTSSTRAMLFDSQAKAVPKCQVQVSHLAQQASTATTADGKIEFDPTVIFTAVTEAVDRILQQAGPLAERIGGVAMDTFVTNIMGLDAAGHPLTPLYTYADTRNAEDAQTLRNELGVDGMATAHDRTGCLVHAAYQPARFRWLARTQPDILARTARWASIGEYIMGQLFGKWAVSYSVASWTGLLNRHSLTWDRSWLAELPIEEEHLSRLTDVNQPLIGLKADWATRWPALKDVPWFPAIGDGAAANIGSGCDSPQRIALTVGSTGAMRMVVTGAISTVPDGLWLYRVDDQRALLGGATTEGGNFFGWLRQTLRLAEADTLEQSLAGQSPTAHGLTVLPFIAGERAPGWRDDARASLIGFTLDTRPIDIVRSGLESMAYRYALIYRRMMSQLVLEHETQIIASGGGLLSSPTWLQIMADVLSQPIATLSETEATSRGIALLALESLGIINDTTELPPATGQIYQPNPQHLSLYQAALEKQLQIYNIFYGDDGISIF